jgi:diacylglycerol kinase
MASLGHALRGLRVFASQPNARIHCAAALVVVAAASWLGVSRLEWTALLLAIALVMSAEALNTALEYVVDLASPDWHPLARDAKDVAAGAVLLCSLGAAAVGLLVFWPYL